MAHTDPLTGAEYALIDRSEVPPDAAFARDSTSDGQIVTTDYAGPWRSLGNGYSGALFVRRTDTSCAPSDPRRVTYGRLSCGGSR